MKQQQQRDSDINDIDPEYFAVNKQHQRKPSINDIEPESPGPMVAMHPVRLDDLLQGASEVMPRPTADLKAEYAICCMFDEEWR